MLLRSPPSPADDEHEHFALRARHDPDGFVLEVYGELDVEAAGLMSARLRECEAASGHIVIDLSGLDLITTAGAEALLIAEARARREGRPLAWLRPPSHVQWTLPLMGVADHVRFVD